MRLFTTSLWIACRHSGKKLLCLLCILAVCGLLGYAALDALDTEPPGPVQIALVNEDSDPLSRMAVRMVVGQDRLDSMFEVHPVTREEADAGGFGAVITIPDGFLAGVLNGSNPSPVVEVHAANPLEAVWVRQMARTGAEYLTLAQLCVYTVQEGVGYGEGLAPGQYTLLLTDVNLEAMRAILERDSLLGESPLSATGGLSLPAYYLAALFPVLVLCYAFFYQPTVASLRCFSSLCGRKLALFGAAWLHLFLLMLFPTALLFWLGERSARMAAVWLLLGALLGTASLLLLLLFRRRTASAVGCLLVSAGLGFCSGGFLPLGLMPPAFSRIAPFTVTGQARVLASTLLGEPVTGTGVLQAVGMTVCFLLFCGFLWRRGER